MKIVKINNPFLVLLVLTYLFGCSQGKQDVVQFERSISLEGQPNFRDLGGYETGNDKHLKTGLLYRSGTLSRLTEADIEKIQSLNIKTVVNFLTEEERNKNGEDKLPKGIKSIFLPISGQNNEAVTILKARQNGDFSQVPADINYKIHTLLIEDAQEEYAQLFHILSDEKNYPIIFHCSHGIHRTGTAASLILSTLGVPWETVRQDYLLSNEYRKEEIDQRVRALIQLADENQDITDLEQNKANIEAFYILKGEYIDGTKTTIEDNFGSFDQYLKSIGIQKEEIENIKKTLLE
jgi:protein-tyrosine phosphatase